MAPEDRMTSEITNEFAIYNADCLDVLPQIPDGSIHLSVYSPPFCGLYNYSSDDRDMSNCRNREEFFTHYGFLVAELARVTMPGRITAVHCMDIPGGKGTLYDFPGDIVRLHEKHDLQFIARHAVWKEPLGVRMRTMAKGLAHGQVVEDASLCDVASADYLLLFRKKGDNPIPVEHPRGLMHYAGSRVMPAELLQYRGWEGHHTENSFSHWIWRQYASAFWDDVRIDRVLPYLESRDPDDEKHVHPLQLDVIERVIVLRSNPGETVLTPFMGVGSEVYGAVLNGRKAIGIELKPSYYKQAVKNVSAGVIERERIQAPLFATAGADNVEQVKARTLVRNTWKTKKQLASK
jgi:DNA modification methylase